MNRRRLLQAICGTALAGSSAAGGATRAPKSLQRQAHAQAQQRQTRGAMAIKAVVFDAFPIFDPRPVFQRVLQLFPDGGAEIAQHWRSRQFEYQWLRALSGAYVDFWHATEDALVYAARAAGVTMTVTQRAELMSSFLELRPWPDVPDALRALQSAGLRLAILSNATPAILTSGLRNGGLQGAFEHVVSTDALKTFKPDPRAYQAGCDALQLAPGAILFAAFAGWDAAGAKWFGHPTFWVNRANATAEELATPADGVGATLQDLVSFVAR